MNAEDFARSILRTPRTLPRHLTRHLTITHRKLPDHPSLVSVAGGWDAHVGILEDVLMQRTPRGFWSTHAQLEAEYGRRIAG